MEHVATEHVVTSGKLHHVTDTGQRVTLRPGDKFFPTDAQVRKNALENKARPTGSTRMRAISVGVDFDEDGNIIREGRD